MTSEAVSTTERSPPGDSQKEEIPTEPAIGNIIKTYIELHRQESMIVLVSRIIHRYRVIDFGLGVGDKCYLGFWGYFIHDRLKSFITYMFLFKPNQEILSLAIHTPIFTVQ